MYRHSCCTFKLNVILTDETVSIPDFLLEVALNSNPDSTKLLLPPRFYVSTAMQTM